VVLVSGGSSSKTPTAWAKSFCGKVEGDAQALKKQSDSIQDENLDQVADFLDASATFLDKVATTITSLGAPDTAGGKQMVQELPGDLRDAANKFRTVSKDVRDGNMSSMSTISSIEPAGNLGSSAKTAWTTMQDEFKTSPDCATLGDVFN
jgi:hypothetical protein